MNEKSYLGLIVILLTIIISLIINSKVPKYRYDTESIELKDTNYFNEVWVIKYICTDGIKVESIQSRIFNIHSFYASAWKDALSHDGACIIKIKTRIS